MKRDMRHEGDRKILAEARVIGCTTHGATTRKELLRAAGATVLVVEEAAEILEAHVITSISEEIEQIIMIGDHQQLRPKAAGGSTERGRWRERAKCSQASGCAACACGGGVR